VVIGTLLWPPLYRSSAAIFVQNNRAQLLVSPDLQTESSQNPAIIANPVSEQDLNSEVELLTSVHLIRQAIMGLRPPHESLGGGLFHDTLGIALQLPNAGYRMLHSSPTLNPQDSWALKLARHVGASVIKRSDMIEVNFSARDPRWAHDFLTRLINEYQEYHAGLSHDPEAEQFFNEQAKRLAARLANSEDKLRQFEINTGITSVKEQQAALVTRLSTLQIEQSRTAANLAAAQQRIASLNQQIKNTPERINKETRSVQNAALQQIKPEVMQLEAERADLATRYQPNSRRLTEIDAKLAAARRILERENHLELQESSTDVNPVWVTVDQDLDKAQTSAASLQATQTALNQEIQQMRQQLTDMVNNGLEIDRLSRQVATDKQAYLAYVRKGEEARAAQGLNLNKILNVSLAQPPTQPLSPVFPVLWLNFLGGAALAVCAGFGAAYWEERNDPRIYSPADIEEASGVTTIAILRNEA
jgi:uncharacterized protein involved in exopolysaccharide biosynthesis